MDEKKKKNKFLQLWLIVGILAGFATILFFSITYLSEKILCDVSCRMKNETILILTLLSLFGMFIGSLMYYFISEKYERKITKIDKEKSDIVLKFLDREEEKIMRIIIEKGGKTTQSEISKNSEMSRVKIFRILKKLEDKKILIKKQQGMTNSIELEENFKKVFID